MTNRCESLQEALKPLVMLMHLPSASAEELSALLPSVLDKAFKGEL